MDMTPAKLTCLNKVRFKVTLQAFASHGSVDHMQRFRMQQWRLRFAAGFLARVIALSLPKDSIFQPYQK
jgi:hypothetical protein